MTAEQRSARRFPCRVRFVGGGRTTLEGEVRDLSPTGLCLATRTRVDRGTQLHLAFTLPAGEVEAVGEVRWAKGDGEGALELGIRFVRIAAAAQQAIEASTREEPAASRWIRLQAARRAAR